MGRGDPAYFKNILNLESLFQNSSDIRVSGLIHIDVPMGCAKRSCYQLIETRIAHTKSLNRVERDRLSIIIDDPVPNYHENCCI